MRYSNKDFEKYNELKQALFDAKIAYLQAYMEWCYFNLRVVDKGYDLDNICGYLVFEKCKHLYALQLEKRRLLDTACARVINFESYLKREYGKKDTSKLSNKKD